MIKILKKDGLFLNVDSETDFSSFLNSGWVELSESELAKIDSKFYKYVSPETVKIVDGEIVCDFSAIEGSWSGIIRSERDSRINAVSWRIERYRSEIRQGLTPTDDITKLDTYVQALRDITTDENFPWDGDISKVSWPEIQE